MRGLFLNLWAVGGYRTYFPKLLMHAAGRLSATSTSSRRARRWFTSAAARAWHRCARTSPGCWNTTRAGAGSVIGMAREEYLASHPNPGAIEFYLCGPPMMIKVCTKILEKLGVQSHQIACDEF